MNMFAQLKLFCENESYDVISCIKLGVFINAIDGFDSHANVANGASDFIVEILGNSSKHTRFAIGAGSLPRNTPIEIDGIFEVKRL
jgi:enamine deaminase RidA (YjgF/YER057c/UK114 family)